MTSLRRRLDITLKTLAVLREKLQKCNGSPPCCLVFHEGDLISCDVFGPAPEKMFQTFCENCRETMNELLDCLQQALNRNVKTKKEGNRKKTG